MIGKGRTAPTLCASEQSEYGNRGLIFSFVFSFLPLQVDGLWLPRLVRLAIEGDMVVLSHWHQAFAASRRTNKSLLAMRVTLCSRK